MATEKKEIIDLMLRMVGKELDQLHTSMKAIVDEYRKKPTSILMDPDSISMLLSLMEKLEELEPHLRGKPAAQEIIRILMYELSVALSERIKLPTQEEE